MKFTNADLTRKQSISRARLIGYVLFGITVLACAAWIMYQYYLISGWEPMHVFSSHPFWHVMFYDIPSCLILVSLVGGLIANSKPEKILSLVICYAYLLLVVLIMPICWSAKNYTPMRIIEDTICYCSWYSIIIIPVFSASCFFAWCAKKLIKYLK